MAKKFRDLVGKLTPAERAHVDAKKAEMLAEMRLYDLRRARSMSQATVAQTMGVPQSAISKIERRTDAYIGTIRRYLEAMGGTLRIVAEFPDGEVVEINQFGEIPDADLIEA